MYDSIKMKINPKSVLKVLKNILNVSKRYSVELIKKCRDIAYFDMIKINLLFCFKALKLQYYTIHKTF